MEEVGLLYIAPSSKEQHKTPSLKACYHYPGLISPTLVSEYLASLKKEESQYHYRLYIILKKKFDFSFMLINLYFVWIMQFMGV